MTDEDRSTDRMARALGWASVGLGLPLLARARRVTQVTGVGDGFKQRSLATFVGARELASAAGLFHPRLRPQWVWTRVAGDAMDLAALGRALRNHHGKGRSRTAAATAAIAGIAAADVYAALRQRQARGKERTVELTGTTTVGREPQEVYAHWRALGHLPEFMAHIEDVRVESASRSHWTVTAPFGRTVEWEAEITDDQPGRLIAWQSLAGDITNRGLVRFAAAPKGQGTEVHVTISYDVPGGKLGEALARWAGEDPRQQIDDDLRRFKQVMETGEVVRSEGAPWGKKAREEFPQHAAQPLSSDEYIDLAREEVPA